MEHAGKTEELGFDLGFICLGMKAHAPLWDELSAAFSDGGTELLNIGDSRRAARIIEGVDAGRHQTLAALERLGCFD